MKNFRHFAAVLTIAPFLAACETPVETETFPEMTFQHLPALNLETAAIEKIAAPVGSNSRPEVAAQFPVLPSAAVARWVDDRLKTAGAGGTARFTVIRADVHDTPLEVDKGVTGLFKKELSDKYSAVVEARLELVSADGSRRAEAAARAEREATMREDATVNERRRQLYRMVESLMADFNAEMEKNIRQHMAGFLN